MNYYVYRNEIHVRSFATAEEAQKWVEAEIKKYGTFGAKGHPAFKVCYNGRESVLIREYPFALFDKK